MKLTLEDVRMLIHFWNEYRCLEKYRNYKNLSLRRDAPGVAKAYHDYLEE